MAIKLNKDAAYKAAKPKEKDYSINDGGGLFLFVSTGGSKLWRFVYQFNGKRKKIAFGGYPEVTLENARRKAEEAREQIANNIDPAELRKESKLTKQIVKENEERKAVGLYIKGSFADITMQWLDSIDHLTKKTTSSKKVSRLQRLAFPSIGDTPIDQVKAGDVLAILTHLRDIYQ
ncbi:MAG: integrase arm-type DNA-binding domain-containing protein [Methylococcaceae bacterium]|nr:integrase arm-type DNA-binding domain-containing protein [Methylococcaceae bacterium]